MSASASIRLDFADGEYLFRLPIGRLRELQEKTGVGPFKVFERLQNGSWLVDDIRETIRLGLIGGGLDPAKAIALVARYVDEFPLLQSVPIAHAIVAAAIIGVPDDPVGKPAAEEAGTEATTASPSPPSTEPAPPSDGPHDRLTN